MHYLDYSLLSYEKDFIMITIITIVRMKIKLIGIWFGF